MCGDLLHVLVIQKHCQNLRLLSQALQISGKWGQRCMHQPSDARETLNSASEQHAQLQKGQLMVWRSSYPPASRDLYKHKSMVFCKVRIMPIVNKNLGLHHVKGAFMPSHAHFLDPLQN